MEMPRGINLNNMFSKPITIINLVLSRYTCTHVLQVFPNMSFHKKLFQTIFKYDKLNF